MVSELSARLLKGYNITYSTASASGGKRMSDFSSNSSCSSNNSSSNGESDNNRSRRVDRSLAGTSATSAAGRLSGSSTSSSSIVKSTDSKNDDTERQSNRDACFKRRKIDELRFAASRVKEDLEKGGLPFPSIHAKKPRALEGFDINMSNIRLLDAKSVSDSPFLTPHFVSGDIKSKSKSSSSSSSNKISSFQSNFCDVGQLFNETQKAYSKRWIQGDISSRNSDCWEKSSSGSLTSDSESSCVVDIPPLLEDSLKYKFSEINTQPLAASIKTVSMGSALENSNEARLVTLSFAPFLIIHVNAAYTRMTGKEPKDILGKPFRDIFKDKRCKAMASSVSSLASMHEQLTSVSTVRQDKRCNCSLQISLVGPTDSGASDADESSCDGSNSSTGSKNNKNKAANATHCMVAVHPTDQENANFGSQPIVTSVPSLQNALPCGVIG